MKTRGRLFLLCALALLALALAVPALAEGSAPVPRFANAKMYDHTFTFAEFSQNDEIGLLNDGYLMEYAIDKANYDECYAYYGEHPTWRLEMISNDGNVSWQEVVHENGDKSGVQAWVTLSPQHSSSMSYRVICNWGGQDVLTGRGVVEYVRDVTLPTGTDIPSEVRLTVGQEKQLHFSFAPSSFYFGNENRLVCSIDGGRWNRNTEGHTLMIKALEAGVFSGSIRIVTGNIAMERSVQFIVEDAAGETPPTPTFDNNAAYDRVFTYARFDNKNNGDFNLEHEKYLMEYNLVKSSYEACFEYYNNTHPTWRVEWDGNDGSLRYNEIVRDNGDVSGVNVWIENEPQNTDALTYRVICNWGGQDVLTGYGRIEYQNGVTMPTGSTVPSEIHLRAGKEWSQSFSFTPETFSFGGEDRINVKIENARYHWHGSGHTAFITVNDPGVYSGNIAVICGNIVIVRKVQFIVENDDTPPTPEFDTQAANNHTFIFARFRNNGEIRLEHNTYLMEYNLIKSSYEACYAYYNNTHPTWRVEWDGNDGSLRYNEIVRDNGDVSGVNVWIENEPQNTDALTYRVICNWGGQDVLTGYGRIEYQSGVTMPTGSTVPSEIHLQAGKEWSQAFSFTPETFSFGGEDRINVKIENARYHWHGSGHTAFITVNDPGVYSGNIAVICGNIVIVREVQFIVDPPAPWFDTDDGYGTKRMLLPLLTPETDGAGLSTNVIGVGTDNTDIMVAYYPDETPTWTVKEQPEGFTLKLTEYPENGIGWTRIMFESVPEQAGEYRAVITCAWGGQSTDLPIYVFFTDNVPPAGNSLPHVVRLGVGETWRQSVSYLPADYYASPNNAHVSLDPEDTSFVRAAVGDSSVDVELQGIRPGAVHGWGMATGNILGTITQRQMTIIVKSGGKTLNIPAGVKTIKAEAFVGVAAETVVIPDGCTTIGSRAFAGCDRLVEIVIPASVTDIAGDAFDGCAHFVINTPSAEVQAYAENHGFLWIDD